MQGAEEVIASLWSPGCGPCKMMEPIVVSLATRYQGRVKAAEALSIGLPTIYEKLKRCGIG